MHTFIWSLGWVISSAHAQTLALYTDMPVSPIEQAAMELGLTVQTSYADPAGFAAQAAVADIVAVDSLMSWPDVLVEATVAQAVADDRLVLYSSWALASARATQTVLGVTAVEYTDPLRHVATGEGANLLGSLGGVLLPSMAVSAPVDGQYLTLTGPGWFAARDLVSGAGTIAVTHGDQVIVNGLVGYDYLDVDRDRDGLPDAVNLYLAELDLLLGRSGGPHLAIGGGCNSKMSVDITGLRPRRSFAIAIADTIGLGSAAGPTCTAAPLGLSAGSLRLIAGAASGSGTVSLSFFARGALCGRYVQVLDLGNCTATNVVGPL